MEYQISGSIAQNVRIALNQGETLWAGRGTLMAYSKGIQWNLRVPGGLEGALKRTFAGEGISLIHVAAAQDNQYVLLAANEPGHIETWDLADGPVVTTRGAFLCAWGETIDINVTIARRAGAAFFGGSGLFLQRISGKGKVLIHGSGDFYERNLESGEQILVSTGNLAAFADQVDYDIEGVGGCRKILFSGEGLFMTRLTGPGRVLLQTLKRTIVRKSGIEN
ncbi:MAG: TIGR00266 family protein [Anaerolineae bacterium]|nr:TIGR00266 family protein [Anaerolineae bacterium]